MILLLGAPEHKCIFTMCIINYQSIYNEKRILLPGVLPKNEKKEKEHTLGYNIILPQYMLQRLYN